MMQLQRLFTMGIVYVLLIVTLAGQQSNPFELSPRLSPEAQAARAAAQVATDTTAPANPFDLEPRQSGEVDRARVQSPVSTNPFELAPRQQTDFTPPVVVAPPPPVVRKEDKPEAGAAQASDSSWILPGLVGILGLTAIFFIFFRALYRKAYKAMFNDNLLSQLYRERSGGNIGGFFLTYLLFLLSGSLFLTLAAGRMGYTLSQSLGYSFLWVLGAVSGVFLLKHIVLALMGYVLPIDKETSRYSFTIMVYGILLGPILSLASLAVAYAAPNLQIPLIYGTAFIVAAAFIVRSLRGLFIANRFIITYGFHFLLYLCAIEIIPLLWIYKLIFRA